MIFTSISMYTKSGSSFGLPRSDAVLEDQHLSHIVARERYRFV